MDTKVSKTLYEYDKKLADSILHYRTEFPKIYEKDLKELRELNDKHLNENVNVTLTSHEEILKKQNKVKHLSEKITKLSYPEHIFNPLSNNEISENYKKYLRMCPTKPKVIFFGMNPGLDGMPQTGLPFGNITTAKKLGIYKEDNNVDYLMKNMKITKKKQQKGKSEERSGKLLWTTIFELVDKKTFFQECFVLNLCPLVYFDDYFKVVTQAELKGYFKIDVEKKCIDKTDEILNLLKPDYVVAFGNYVENILDKCKYNKPKIKLRHPSYRAIKNKDDWKNKLKAVFEKNHIQILQQTV